MKLNLKAVLLLATLLAVLSVPLMTGAATVSDAALYNAYRYSLNAVQFEDDIPKNGFRAIESQTFDVEHGQLGRLKLIPAIHREYGRMALFFVLGDGSVVLKTDDFMANTWLQGELRQTNRDVICISCVDLDGDELQDIIVISSCSNDSMSGSGKTYNVGDVLFQNETGFYRDPRVSDKINRFDMNKSAEYIGAFVHDGVSMEFLFVAKDFNELLAGGMKPINYLRVSEHLEKFGVVEVIPGFYSMMGQSYLMIYIVGQDGNVLWDFQPMHQHESFYDILAMSLKDIDGDGSKDLTLLARYAASDGAGGSYLITDYEIYYQRAGYFLEDTEFKRGYACGEDDNIDTITEKARQYWGWPQ